MLLNMGFLNCFLITRSSLIKSSQQNRWRRKSPSHTYTAYEYPHEHLQVNDTKKNRETGDASLRLKQLEKAAPELAKQCTNEVRRIAQLISDRAYRNENITPASIHRAWERVFDHSLPVFSRKEKTEYESRKLHSCLQLTKNVNPSKGKCYVYLTVNILKRLT